MSFIVESFSGPAAGRKFDLPDAVTVTFGRTDKARFVIPEDKHLSSAHFSLECRGEKCKIRDLSSTNGTFVNSLRVTEAEIAIGAVISAGSCSFKLCPGMAEEWIGFSPRHRTILSRLYGYGQPVFAVLDTTREDRLPAFLLAFGVQHVSLCQGESREQKAGTPYVALLPKESQLWPVLMKEGWGKNWGIYFNSDGDLPAVSEHLRRIMELKDDDDRLLYFRFYDPCVLRVIIPACTPEESTVFFGPISRFVVEGDDLDNPIQFRGAPQLARTALDQAAYRP
jgi:pSer/pThr/pTyr-binding forkhead associated (FHA) protein